MLARHTGILVFGLYLLTMAGHTSSPDEESLFYMTKSLVDHGRLDIPEDGRLTSNLLAAGQSGRAYAPYGPVVPILLAPFYIAGDAVAKAFEPGMREYVLRLATNLLDPTLTALSVAVLVRFATDLGASGAAAVTLALTFGLATIAWPYSKWLWSEPAAALALLLALFWTSQAIRRPGLRAPLLAGLAFAVAVGTKLPTLVALPGFLGALLLPLREGAQPGWRGGLTRLAAFAAFPVALATALVAWNRSRFGHALETGYQALGAGASAFDWGSGEGILGLLLSSGKSVFLYSPPLVLGIAGLRRFSIRAPRESLLVLWLVASHVIIYGSFARWHGDACWGPRYLVPITAPLLLPAISLLDLPSGRRRRALRAALALLVIAGVTVQMAGLLMNYAAYTVRTDADGGVARRFDWGQSPVVGHFRLLASHIRSWRAFTTPDVTLARGFSWPEGSAASPLARWASGEAELDVRAAGRAPLHLELDYVGFRPRSLEPARVRWSAEGRAGAATRTSFDATSQRGTLTMDAPVEFRDPLLITVSVENPWRPAADAGLPDPRELGVFVTRVKGEARGHRLTVGAALVPRLPLTTRRPWGPEAMAWFYEPPHLIDAWPWYVWFSGLPRALLLLAALPALAVIGETLALARRFRGTHGPAP